MTDRKHQVGSVHGVEMKIRDAVIDEVNDLLSRDRSGDQPTCHGIRFQPGETISEPTRHGGAAALGKNPHLLEVLHRQNAGHHRDGHAAGAHAIEIAKINVVIEEELRDRAAGAGIDFRLEHIDIGIDRRAVRMLLRISRHRHLDVGDAFDAGHQIGSVAITLRMRRVAFADAADRIAPQSNDVADAGRHIGTDHAIDLRSVSCDAGQMRGRRKRRLSDDALNGRVRALPGRSPGPVGDGDEGGRERRKPRYRLPQGPFHLLGFGWKELEGDAHAAPLLREAAGARLGDGLHQATSRRPASARRGSWASHRDTAILPSEPGSGARLLCTTPSSPACSIHCVTVSGGKPSRRWAYSSRRNSSSCGAKSTTSSRPWGRNTRAASRMARPPSSRKCSTWWMMTTSKESRGTERSKMSPCRTLQLRMPAWSSRLRAKASISGLRSTPRPRSISELNNSRMRPVPVPRSSKERNGRASNKARISASTAWSGAWSWRMRSHSAAWRRK